MFKKMLLIFTCTMLLLALAACGGGGGTTAPQDTSGGQTADANAVTLKIFGAWAENNSNLIDMNKFIDKVSEKSGGTVIIEWGGGPEVYPSFQLVEAIKNQMVDIAWTAHTYNVSHVPVMEGMKLTDADLLRENGGFEFVDQLYVDALGAHYLGSPTNGLTYNMYTKKEITTLDDFKGLTIRATPAYQAFVEGGLGSGVVNTDASEAYQALERNVIQGTGWPSFGIMDFGWQEVLDFVVEPAFYSVDVALFVSDKAWQQLDENQRNALLEAAKEVEQEAKEYYVQAILDDRDKLVENGLQINVLAPDVAAEYLDLAYGKAWESVLKADPENGQKLMNYTTYGQ